MTARVLQQGPGSLSQGLISEGRFRSSRTAASRLILHLLFGCFYTSSFISRVSLQQEPYYFGASGRPDFLEAPTWSCFFFFFFCCCSCRLSFPGRPRRAGPVQLASKLLPAFYASRSCNATGLP